MKYLIITICLLVGVGFIIAGGVIKHKVGEGYQRIASAERNVGAMERLANSNQYTAPAGQVVGSYARGQIESGRQQADHYATMSNWFLTIGVLLVVFSSVAFVIYARRS